jgi:2-polyprenyl-3-methyl-5-hydroxy-6-metoxy-1,4-benzoquinol methylase
MEFKPQRDIDSYSKEYDANKFEAIQASYRRKKVIEEINTIGSNLKILELGCGLDSLCNHIHNFSEFHIIEPSSMFYKKAEENRDKHVLKQNIFLYNEYAENVEINNKFFDVVLISGLLHEVPYPNIILQAIHKLCTSKTIVHINVPNANSFHRIWALQSGFINTLEELSKTQISYQQYRTFTMESLINLAVENKFYILNKGSYFVKPFTHNQMQILLDEKIITSQHLDGLYNLVTYFPENGSEIYINVKISE